MSEYEYKSGKTRIQEILNNKLNVIESDELPKDESLTFTNSYKSWVTGIFIDIRDSSNIFSKEDKVLVSKVIRSFTSEVIEILRSNDYLREIGIRGDCVYAIYTTPLTNTIYDILDYAFYINTFMKMLNALLKQKELPEIDVGIGLSTAQELVIKAGRKDTGINNKVWIGNAVSKASNLSSLGNRNGYRSIVISSCTYTNTIEQLVKISGEEARTWFTERYDSKYGTFYDGYLVKTGFNKWIDDGMRD
jgi:class 3 adenylate cyclase